VTGTEIERFQPQGGAVSVVANLDSWVAVMAEVCKLAGYIADTSFVPESLRGNAPAVAAAILTGREMGVPPMMALANIHVIKGKPGQSALLMRAMVQAAGHEIKDIEATAARCVLHGRRKGESEWTPVAYTADQARNAKPPIDLSGYPEDKLYARATTRLCRRKFADVIAGLAYSVDELEDLRDDRSLTAPPAAPAIEPPKRTAKRKTAPAAPQPAALELAARLLTGDALDEHGQEYIEDPSPPATPAAPDGPPLPLPGEEDGREDGPATQPQLTRLHTFFTEHDITDRDQKLEIARALTGRADLQSSTELTRRDAAQLIDALAQLATQAGGQDIAHTIDLLVHELGARRVVDDDTTNEPPEETP
jgi:hypothetical protein